MKYKIELKTNIVNDGYKRMPSLEDIKLVIDKYSFGFKGIVLFHDSLYDYTFDTKLNNYHNVDSNMVIGNITKTIIEDNKLYLIVDCVKDLDLDEKYICTFRAKLKSSIKNDKFVFDSIEMISVDLIIVEKNVTVLEKDLSEITKY